MTVLGLEGGGAGLLPCPRSHAGCPPVRFMQCDFTLDDGRDLVVRPISPDGTGHLVATTPFAGMGSMV